MNIEKMFDVRANSSPAIISSDGEFFNNFVEYIRSNSILLNKCIIVLGNPQSNYYFDIEGSSNVVYEETISSGFKPINGFSCVPKLLASEFGINRAKYNTFFNGIEKMEKQILENLLYKPFMRSIEKNVISGNYFSKSIFENCETITGTNNFTGLLKLVRYLKNKNENNYIVINPTILSEYLLNKTIEGVRIIETLECPASKIVGVNPEKICLVMSPELQIKKFSVLNFPLDYIFHVYSFANGGDMFDTAVGFNI